ncbi:MAG: glycosyltransferase [Methanobrevibacter sp.]|jgi:cellulose synthase/poly-beta-1,6-N-acetylglucosamine synthase-like glycosyltransferase|nr:glycosyltransferase [Candidatus Methanoflexus mossambicus]
MKDYKITIVFQVFNVRNYIKNTLDSLVDQTIGFKNIQILLLYNDSTDGTERIIKEYEFDYDNVEIIYLKDHLNEFLVDVVINNVNSEKVMFSDSDESYSKDFIEKKLKDFEESGNSYFIFSKSKVAKLLEKNYPFKIKKIYEPIEENSEEYSRSVNFLNNYHDELKRLIENKDKNIDFSPINKIISSLIDEYEVYKDKNYFLDYELSATRRKFKETKKRLAITRTFKGYLRYKLNNILKRIKFKFKGVKERSGSEFLENKFKDYTGDYSEVTVIISYRKTNDKEREKNLDICLHYLNHIGFSKVFISEHSSVPNKSSLIDKYSDLFDTFKVIHTNSLGESFWKGKALNNAVMQTETDYIAILDLDCISKKRSINIALNMVKSGYDSVHTFNRKIKDIEDKEDFVKAYDFSTIDTPLQNRFSADGGLVFWNKKSYVKIGMDNEYFKGLTRMDNELMERAKLFGLKQYRVNDILYHLSHIRPPKNNPRNKKLLTKFKNYTPEECYREVDSWQWVKKAKKKFNYD